MKLLSKVIFLIVVLLLACCNESRIVEPPLEQKRPEFKEMKSPPDSAFAFNVSGKITLEFNEPMDINTFPNNFIIWEDEEKTSKVEGNFSTEGSKVIFTPGSHFKSAHQYFVELKSRVKDKNGNGIDKDTIDVYTGEFFTGGNYSQNISPEFLVSNGSEDILSRVYIKDNLLTSDTVSTLDNFGRQLEMAYSSDGQKLLMTDYNTSNSGIYFLDVASFKVKKKLTNNHDNTEIKKSAEIVVGGNNAYVVNQTSKTISVVDVMMEKVTNTILLPDIPKGLAISSDNSKLYVGSARDNRLWVIDINLLTIVNTFNVEGLKQSVRVAVSTDGKNVIIRELRTNNLFFVDSRNGNVNKIIDLGYQAKTGNNNDLAVAGDHIFVSSSDGFISKINTTSFSVEGQITHSNIQGIDVYPSSEILIATLRETPAKIAVIISEKMKIINIVEIGGSSPWDIAIRPNM